MRRKKGFAKRELSATIKNDGAVAADTSARPDPNKKFAAERKRGKMFAGTTVRRLVTALAALGFVGLVVGLPIAVNFPLTSDALHGALLYAGGRDAVMVTTPVRLSWAPSVVLEGGLVYDPDSVTTAADRTAVGKIMIDGPVIRVATMSGGASPAEAAEESLPLILSHLSTLAFEKLQVRRGTLMLVSQDGSREIFSEITAEVTSNRKGNFTGKGSASYRGANLVFDAAWSPGDGKPPLRIPLKLTLKSAMLDATIDGKLGITEGLRLQGLAEVTAPKLKQLARWFAIAVPSGADLKNVGIKGTLDWGVGTLTFSRAAVIVDGNEGTGALALSTSEALPSVDGTLAFQNFDLSKFSAFTPTLASIWPLGFGPGEDEGALSLLTRFNADLRMSAAKVTLPYLQTGRGAATIAVKNGKLTADVAELEMEGGTFGGQISADMRGPVPRYALSGKLENVDAGRSLSGLLHRNPLQGRANIALNLTGSGHETGDILKSLSGKVGFTLNEGGRLGLDLRALLYAAQRSDVKGWAAAGKGQTALELLDARLQIENGVIMSEQLQAKSAGLSIAGSGRVDIAAKSLDLALLLTSGTERTSPGDTLLFTGNWLDPTIRIEQHPKRTAAPN